MNKNIVFQLGMVGPSYLPHAYPRLIGRHALCFFGDMKIALSFLRRLPRLAHTLTCLAVLYSTAAQSAPTPQTLPDQLIGTAQAFLEATVADYLQRSAIAGRHEIDMNRLDPRLRMPFCDQPLYASLENPPQPIGRVTVRVGCSGRSPWSVFVPAQVRLYRDVVAVARPLSRSSTLGFGDIRLAERDVGQLSQGYLTELDQALGYKLTRPVTADQVLTPNHLERADVISKGDQVVISARNTGLNVRMPGEALGDGAPGEQIRVRNLSSKRIIKARITGPGQVEVDL
jgi:flagella basal body P-ring formation protein FlgA